MRVRWKNGTVMTATNSLPAGDAPDGTNTRLPAPPGDARAIEFSVHGLSKRLPAYSAHKRFSLGQRIGIALGLIGVVAFFAFEPIIAGIALMSILTILYLGMLGLRDPVDLMHEGEL